MMRPGDAMLILLPVLCLLSGASWAATLGGLGGECNRKTQTHESNIGVDDFFFFFLKRSGFPPFKGLSSLR